MSLGHGIILALTAALLWGSYTSPLKVFTRMEPLRYLVGMSPGILLVSLGLAWYRGTWPFNLWGIFDGAYWAIGSSLSFAAVHKEGLSGASARWMGTGILVSFLLGVTVLGEQVSLSWAVVGLALLLAGLYFGTKDFSGATTSGKFNLRQSWRSFVAGTIFGSYYLPVHYSGLHALDFAPSMGVGIGISALIIALVVRPAPMENMRQSMVVMAAGIGWNLASVCALLSMEVLGLAVGFPLTQMALLVTIAWGVLVFGEARSRTMRIFIALAAVCLLGGAALLSVAKNLA